MQATRAFTLFMSATLQCCTPCATTETVNTPGSEGTPGTDGTNGQNAYTVTVSQISFTPGGGEQAIVGVVLESAVWLVVGQIVIIGDGVNSVGETDWGHFRVTAITSATTVNLTYLDYAGDGAGDGILLVGCTVSPAGQVGPAGP